ncbi:Co2+/Mg2+ efflux protein ApaG [Agaricicola taiwanensis]|nr:Co2+/Mg2+ efflux protein ApaG [Agaricicola taiwanensis]
MYYATTRGIEVLVTPRYLPQRSKPREQQYAFSYTIIISNRSKRTVQLLTRHWRVTDETGQTREVHGDGVVGEQPVLAPGETFEYTSGVPLPTPTGMMFGTYGMRSDKGEEFHIEIPAFSLDADGARRVVN